MHRIHHLLLALVLAAVMTPATGETLSGGAYVIDADTLEIAGERIHFSGIDAPERYQKCRRYGSCYPCGQEATYALRSRIGFSAVRCETSGLDRYGRFIGDCFSKDGEDLQEWLVVRGHALAYREYSRRYIGAERTARAVRSGMHRGEFVPPWEWRRGVRLNPKC